MGEEKDRADVYSPDYGPWLMIPKVDWQHPHGLTSLGACQWMLGVHNKQVLVIDVMYWTADHHTCMFVLLVFILLFINSYYSCVIISCHAVPSWCKSYMSRPHGWEQKESERLILLNRINSTIIGKIVACVYTLLQEYNSISLLLLNASCFSMCITKLHISPFDPN